MGNNNSSGDDYTDDDYDDDYDDDNIGRICARLLKDYNKSSLRSRMNYPNNDKDKTNNNMNSSAPTSSYRVDQTTAQPLSPQEQHQKENQNQIRKQQVIKTPKIVWLQRLIPRGRIDITYNDLWYALLTIGIQ